MDGVFHCSLAWLGGDVPERDVRIDVSGGRITAVTTGAEPPPGAVRLGGLVLPGLANAHSHAFHRALRGRTHSEGGSFWTWREQMYRLAATLRPDAYHLLARAAFAEMALAGVTCVGEFHYLHHQPDGRPYDDQNEMGAALLAAAADAGVRITLLDACYLGGGLTDEGRLRPLEGAQVRFGDGTVDGWCERVEALAAATTGGTWPGALVGAAVHSVRAVDERSIAAVADHAAALGMPLHAHVSEQPAENEQCHSAYGVTPVELLDRATALGPRFTAVHATHLTDRDVALLGSTDSTVCLCPTTERDLADGIAPTADLRHHRVPLALGSDSHAVVDLFEEARAVELHERLVSGTRGNHSPATLLRAATSDGHACLGWRDAGRLEVGAPADLVAVRLDSVRTAGALPRHALAAVVFGATASDVTDVVVAGEPVVRDGRHVRIHVEEELASSIHAVWLAAPPSRSSHGTGHP